MEVKLATYQCPCDSAFVQRSGRGKLRSVPVDRSVGKIRDVYRGVEEETASYRR